MNDAYVTRREFEEYKRAKEEELRFLEKCIEDAFVKLNSTLTHRIAMSKNLRGQL